MPLRTTKIETGLVRGIPCGNPLYTVYKGIPYAASTAGANRFQPPQPAAGWSGERLCDSFSDICLQGRLYAGLPFSDFFAKEFYPVEFPRGEDTLCLNVWTPAADADAKLPVMVWIHGGGFGSGYGHEMEFDGEAICKRDVILVTINYRVGPCGFFAHPELSAASKTGTSGNNGMLDQVAALQWVQRNISAFGGNPDQVTIFGQSAGGMSVLGHLASPLSKGLFAGAIVQSGSFGLTMPSFTHTLADAEAWGVKACALLGLSLAELAALPADDLQDAFKRAEEIGAGQYPKLIIDNHFLTDSFWNIVSRGFTNNVPVMTGVVSGDLGLGFGKQSAAGDINSRLRQRLGGVPEQLLARIAEQADAEIICGDLQRTVYLEDLMIADAQVKNRQERVYVYFFNPEIPGHNESHFVEDGLAYHSAELWYVFGTLDRCWRSFDGRHHDLSRQMIVAWTQFARKGDPNCEGLPVWTPISSEQRNLMNFNETLTQSVTATTPALESFLSLI